MSSEYPAPIQAIIAGAVDPWDLADWDQESESYYFGKDWTQYDSTDVDRIYAAWFEAQRPLGGPVVRFTEFGKVAMFVGHADYTVIAHTERRMWPTKYALVQWSKHFTGDIVSRFIDQLRVSEDGNSAEFVLCEPPCRLHSDPVVEMEFNWYIVVAHHPLDVPDDADREIFSE